MSSGFRFWLYNRCVIGLIGPVLPATWFGPKPPAAEQLRPAGEPLKLEIVAHCWQYAHLLAYQLSSVKRFTPNTVRLTYTLYYCESDRATVQLIEHYAQESLPNIHWNWQPLPEAELKRRAIGRNRSALSTDADWVWFADCDLIFHDGCLASLQAVVSGLQRRMVYPATECITAMLEASSPLVNVDPAQTPEPQIDPDDFVVSPITKAKGAFQIVHGDVARQCGYCPQLRLYQQPTIHWRKTFEDTAFRKLIDDQGTPVEVRALHRIRHTSKGRYQPSGLFTRLRTMVRRLRGE
ncbi:MAG: glycosyltransferase family 2 protein [Pseudomonadota bacterium]